MKRRWVAAACAGAAFGLSPPFAPDGNNVGMLAAANALLPLAQPHTDVTLVLLDAATEAHPSFAALPRAHWSRPLARIVERVLDAEPAVVAVDLVLPHEGRAGPAWLRALRRGAQGGRIVLAAAPGEARFTPSASQVAAAGGTASLASVSLHPGYGGVVRTVAARDGPLPTLAAHTARRAGVEPDGRVPVVVSPRRISAWSAAALVDCPSQPALRAALRRRAVFVGAWLPHEDRHRSALRHLPATQRVLAVRGCGRVTEFRVDEPVPGVLLHAAAAHAWLRGGVHWPARTLVFAAVVGAAAAGASLARARRHGALAVGLGALAVSAVVAFRAGTVLPWLGCSVALAVAATTWVALAWLERGWRFAAALPAPFRETPDAATVGTVTACFADIESFTATSESLSDPAALAQELGACLQRLAEAAEAAGGFVDKYLGDGLLVLFGVDPRRSGPADAVTAVERWFLACAGPPALTIGGRPVRLRVGIATGRARLGALGRTERVHFTAVGDCVNVAARLEQLNRETGTRVLADAATAAGAPHVAWRDCGLHALRGRRGRVRVFALNVRHRSL